MIKFPFYLHLTSSLFIINQIYSSRDKELILWLLLYLSIIISAELFSSKKIIVTVLIFGLVIPYLFFNEYMFIYFGITVTRIASTLSILTKKYTFVPFLIPLPLLNREVYFNYIILSGIFYILSYLIFKSIEKANNLEKKIDTLESDNDKLLNKINDIEEFDNEKEYLLKLEERSKIAGKLHDEIGHVISGSLFQLEACKMIIDDDLPKAKKMINNVTEVLNEGMYSIRKSLKVIKPDTGQIGLEDIKNLLKDFSIRNGIKTQLSTSEGLNSISNNVWGIIKDNSREFLTNTLKYSDGANLVTLNIDVLKGLITARISNNGKGEKVIIPGLGLRGMEERINSENGTLIVDGSKGFTVSMVFKR